MGSPTSLSKEPANLLGSFRSSILECILRAYHISTVNHHLHGLYHSVDHTKLVIGDVTNLANRTMSCIPTGIVYLYRFMVQYPFPTLSTTNPLKTKQHSLVTTTPSPHTNAHNNALLYFYDFRSYNLEPLEAVSLCFRLSTIASQHKYQQATSLCKRFQNRQTHLFTSDFNVSTIIPLTHGLLHSNLRCEHIPLLKRALISHPVNDLHPDGDP